MFVIATNLNVAYQKWSQKYQNCRYTNCNVSIPKLLFAKNSKKVVFTNSH